MDVVHCRLNFSTKVSTLLTYSPDVGTAHRSQFHPWADIATIVELLDVYRRRSPSARDRIDIEAMLDRAIHQIDPP